MALMQEVQRLLVSLINAFSATSANSIFRNSVMLTFHYDSSFEMHMPDNALQLVRTKQTLLRWGCCFIVSAVEGY